jgi:hypothetical protein
MSHSCPARAHSLHAAWFQAKNTILFADFSTKWKALILCHKKPSTQLTIRGHLEN